MRKKTGKRNTKAWWSGLSDEQKNVYIAKKERQRKAKKSPSIDETWSNALGTFHKKSINGDSYSVVRE